MKKTALFLLGLTLLISASATPAAARSDEAVLTALHDAQAQLEKSVARRPFRFKGMNESLSLTLEAVKLLLGAEAAPVQKIPAVSSWASGGPLTPVMPGPGMGESGKQVLNLLDQARRKFSQNNFALALKAYAFQKLNDPAEANRFWEEYLARSTTYSGFDREIFSQKQFKALQQYAENHLRAEGVDLKEHESRRLKHSPLELYWHLVTHPRPAERMLNLIFIVGIVAGTALLIFAGLSGIEFYRSTGFSLITLYAAVWLSYGCWIYDRGYGLPWGLECLKVQAFILGAALSLCLIEAWSVWREANPPLEDGYRRCPRCKEVIVKLSVECMHCKKKLRPQR